MKIGVTGISYRQVPVETREKFVISPENRLQIIRHLCENCGVTECVLLSTCNRTEVYFAYSEETFRPDAIEEALCKVAMVDFQSMKEYFYRYLGEESAKHLFHVACGLDSLVMGEDQILGQIRDSHVFSKNAGASHVILNTLFRQAITAAKTVKTNTAISKYPTSVSSVAIRYADRILPGGIMGKTALVIGSGKMGRISIKYLLEHGVKKLYLTSRSQRKEEDLRAEFADEWERISLVLYPKRYEYIMKADLVISATTGTNHTITYEELNSLGVIGSKVFIDLGVPRNMDEALRQIDGIVFVHMDQLSEIAAENIHKKGSETGRAHIILDKYIEDWRRWYDFRAHLPVVKTLQKFSSEIVERKTEKLLHKLKTITPGEQELVRANVSSAVNGVLDKLLYSVREHAGKEDMDAYFACLRKVMEIEEQ